MSMWGGGYAQAIQQGIAQKSMYEKTEAKMDRERDRLQAFLDTLVAPDAATDILQSMFTGGNLDSLIDFLTNRLPLTKAEKAHAKFFNVRAPMLVNEAISRLRDVFPNMDELLRTGFKTDIAPLREAGQYRLGTVDFPTILGRLGDQLGGSDVLAQLAGSSVDFERQLADLEYGSREAAAGRRVAGLGMAEGTYSAPERVGREGYADIGYQGQLGRIREESTRTGAMPPVPSWLDVLGPLSMVEQQHMIPMSGYGVPNMGGTNWGALAAGGASALGALASGGYNLARNAYSDYGATTYGGMDYDLGGTSGYGFDYGGIGGTGMTDAQFDAKYANSDWTSTGLAGT